VGVLVAGASGGLGAVLGARLAGRGTTVSGTMRDAARGPAGLPFEMLPMEVTDDASAEKCLGKSSSGRAASTR
jgi:NAD(P)-dependent dehydrogenase (short-subunit alcohol dehydrogenase family)